ncbi:MAG TPA: hypothetical protein VLA04_06765 [Verrucomicrobiae bacterium]|nr:hypothetical protein [Verrucomicrobiae bacterium]
MFEEVLFEQPKREVEEYLQRMHSHLKDAYRSPDGRYSASCFAIAMDVAKHLLKEGKHPYTMAIHGETLPDGHSHKLLIPVVYNGETSWTTHVICCEDDTAYDPIVGHPIPIEEYRTTVFTEPAVMHVEMNPEQMAGLLNR